MLHQDPLTHTVRIYDQREMDEASEHDIELVTMALGRHDGDIAEIQCQLACIVAFIGAVHDQRGRLRHWPKIDQKLASRRRVVILAGGESEGDGAAITCGNPMNFGGPATTGFADGLGTVFFERRYHRGAP